MGSSGHRQPFNGSSLLSVSQEASTPAGSQVPLDGGVVTGASWEGQLHGPVRDLPTGEMKCLGGLEQGAGPSERGLQPIL